MYVERDVESHWNDLSYLYETWDNILKYIKVYKIFIVLR